MANNKLAIIGGSGLYDVEEFKYRELPNWSCWVFKVKTIELEVGVWPLQFIRICWFV